MKNNNKNILIVAIIAVIFLSLYFGVTRNPLTDDIAVSNDAELAETEVDQQLQQANDMSELLGLQSNDDAIPSSVEADSAAVSPVPQTRQDNDTTISSSRVADRNASRQSSGGSQRSDSGVPVLSKHVFSVIDEVQKRQQDGQWEEALNEMNALYADFDNLSPFEQVTLLNFYTNTLLRLEMYEETIPVFELMRTIDDLRPDINARSLLALAQLNSRTGDFDAALSYYAEYLVATAGMDDMEQQRELVLQQLAELGVN